MRIIKTLSSPWFVQLSQQLIPHNYEKTWISQVFGNRTNVNISKKCRTKKRQNRIRYKHHDLDKYASYAGAF